MTTNAFGVNLEARQGSRFQKTVTVPYTLTGYTVRMQVRRTPDSDLLLDLSVGSGLAWVNQAGGVFLIDISAVDLAAAPVGVWVYDLELVPAGVEANAYALFGGRFTIAAEVTR